MNHIGMDFRHISRAGRSKIQCTSQHRRKGLVSNAKYDGKVFDGGIN